MKTTSQGTALFAVFNKEDLINALLSNSDYIFKSVQTNISAFTVAMLLAKSSLAGGTSGSSMTVLDTCSDWLELIAGGFTSRCLGSGPTSEASGVP